MESRKVLLMSLVENGLVNRAGTSGGGGAEKLAWT